MNTPDDTRSRPTVPVSTRLDPQLKHDLELLAQSDFNRSLSNYIEKVLLLHVEAAKKKK
jgi:hypothetical protein